MRVAFYEDNLIWSARLARAAAAHGYEVEVIGGGHDPSTSPDVAVIDLASQRIDVSDVVPRLRALGVPVVGHAGHKEGFRLAAGAEAGCTLVVSNRTIAERLIETIQQAMAQGA